MFLLSLRMPSDPNASENLLLAFAYRYHVANEESLACDPQLTAALVLAIVQLNDALYGTFGFALPNHAITQDVFISAFHSRDQDRYIPDRLLADIYSSIRTNSLVQALATHERGLAREIAISPARLPSRLSYDTWSERIYVSIPSPDPSFKIRLHGEGMMFDPPILDFSASSEESFRVKGTSLGPKTVLFDRIGSNAYGHSVLKTIKLINSARYAGLGNSRTFTIERAFMRHTFHVSFMSSTNVKRKYCFSVLTDEMKVKWGQILRKQIAACKSSPSQKQLRQIAEKVSLQVLKDAVIPPDDPNQSKQPDRSRQVSVSTTYEHNAGRDEKALGPLVAPNKTSSERTSGLVEVRTGKELVLLCRQNSLLPGLLELLSAGREDVKSHSRQVPSGQHRTNGSTFGLTHSQSRNYGHGHERVAGGGSMSDAKRGIMTGRF
jgi:hypothetical protein